MASFRATRFYPVPLSRVALALALGAMPLTAQAQSAGDFRLQPGTSGPKPQGPVDPENPASAPTSPSSGPTAAPTVTPVPTPSAAVPIRVPPPPSTRPSANADSAGRADRAAPSARGPSDTQPAPGPVTSAAPAASPTADAAPPPLAPIPATPDVVSSASPPAEPVTAQPTSESESGISWWWLIPAMLLGAIGTWLFLRRRAGETLAPEIERPLPVGAPNSGPSPDPAAHPAAPAPVMAGEPVGPLSIHLDPERLSVSLVNATLQYRLTVTNESPAALGPIAIAADMIGAHASLPSEAQLGQDGAGLELRHEIPGLEPGASAELRGELRLPLAQVTPIRSGSATLLVPLVRLRLEAPGHTLTMAVVVGETPAAPGAPLRPFRLDTGPRIFGAVSQREVAKAA